MVPNGMAMGILDIVFPCEGMTPPLDKICDTISSYSLKEITDALSISVCKAVLPSTVILQDQDNYVFHDK